MGRKQESLAYGDRVFDLLQQCGPLSKRQIMELSGMRSSQVDLGLSVIKETLAGLHAEPIVYDARDNVYVLAADREQIEEYYQLRAKTMLRQTRNLLTGTLEPALGALGDTPYVKLARRQMVRMAEDLEDLIV